MSPLYACISGCIWGCLLHSLRAYPERARQASPHTNLLSTRTLSTPMLFGIIAHLAESKTAVYSGIDGALLLLRGTFFQPSKFQCWSVAFVAKSFEDLTSPTIGGRPIAVPITKCSRIASVVTVSSRHVPRVVVCGTEMDDYSAIYAGELR
jgi:hypothetical protein